MVIFFVNGLPECSMLASVGYVDDYKIVSNNPVIVKSRRQKNMELVHQKFYGNKYFRIYKDWHQM